MVTYPIATKRSSYRGSDAKIRAKSIELDRISRLLEDHINSLINAQREPIRVYSYYEIAVATSVPEETVRDLCFGIDGGGTGFTAMRPGITYEQAIEEHRRGQ